MMNTQEQEISDQQLLAEYTSRLFRTGDIEPIPATLICPECRCDWVSFIGIKTDLDFGNKDEREKVNKITLQFRGACKHNWEIEFEECNGEVNMSDSHFEF
jgi:hypothetical protein